MTASGSRIAEIAGRHRPAHEVEDQATICAGCYQTWPCDAYTFGQMLTPQRVEAAVAKARHELIERNRAWAEGREIRPEWGLGSAFLAALEAQP